MLELCDLLVKPFRCRVALCNCFFKALSKLAILLCELLRPGCDRAFSVFLETLVDIVHFQYLFVEFLLLVAHLCLELLYLRQGQRNFFFARTICLRVLETFYFLVEFVDHDVFQHNVLLKSLVLEFLLLYVDLRLLD